jgi:hypothetical protein
MIESGKLKRRILDEDTPVRKGTFKEPQAEESERLHTRKAEDDQAPTARRSATDASPYPTRRKRARRKRSVPRRWLAEPEDDSEVETEPDIGTGRRTKEPQDESEASQDTEANELKTQTGQTKAKRAALGARGWSESSRTPADSLHPRESKRGTASALSGSEESGRGDRLSLADTDPLSADSTRPKSSRRSRKPSSDNPPVLDGRIAKNSTRPIQGRSSNRAAFSSDESDEDSRRGSDASSRHSSSRTIPHHRAKRAAPLDASDEDSPPVGCQQAKRRARPPKPRHPNPLPEHDGPALPSYVALDIAPRMMHLKRHCLTFACRAFSQLVFRPGLTLLPGHSLWSDDPSEPDSILIMRLHLIHAYIGLLSCDFFAMFVVKPHFIFRFPGLDYLRFLHSICQTSRQFIEDIDSQVVSDLSRNCFVICTQLFPLPEFRQALADIEPQCLLRAFLRSPAAFPVFSPVSPTAIESASFFYMAAISNPGFIALSAKRRCSNCLISHLLYLGQSSYEESNYVYLHSVILSTLLAFVGNSTVATQLSEPFTGFFETIFQPEPGSHGDLVMNIVLNIFGEPEFLPSVAVVFHLIAPYCETFSFVTAGRIFSLLEGCPQQSIATLLLEGLAANLHQPVSGLWIVMAHKTQFFKRFEGRDPRATKALTVIRNYLVVAAKAIKATGKARLSNHEIEEVLERIDFEKLETGKPKRFQQVFAGAMSDTWHEWIDYLFVRVAGADIENIQALQDTHGQAIHESLKG